MQSVITQAGPYTPSESVLLHGRQFAGSRGFNDAFELLGSEEKVRASELQRAVLAAALLANEAAGALRLHVGERKVLFGLRKVPTLFVEPVGTAAPWPTPSLEAQVRSVVESLKGQKEGDTVRQVVYALLQRDSARPWLHALNFTRENLAERGLVETEERTRMKIFKSTEYRLNEAQTAGVAANPPTDAQRLLADMQARRPQEWKLLEKAIKEGTDMRVEEDNDVGGD